MLRKLAFLVAFLPVPAIASDMVDRVIDTHILPSFTRLADATQQLSDTATRDCKPDVVLPAYHTAFDAWMQASHLRFGPTEVNDRAFALAYWPDSKGFTPKTLRRLIEARDESVSDPAKFAKVSIAGRGFFALDFLLSDPDVAGAEGDHYACDLTRAIARDIDQLADDILAHWTASYAETLRMGTAPYQGPKETVQELYKALLIGLQFTSDSRLGRPLGSFTKPRPRRAEAWRTGRSLRNVVQALSGQRALAALLAADHPAIAKSLDRAFADALDTAVALDDPDFAGVTDVQGRLRVEILQQRIDIIRDVATQDLGPALGVGEGFNALDGD